MTITREDLKYAEEEEETNEKISSSVNFHHPVGFVLFVFFFLLENPDYSPHLRISTTQSIF